MADPRRALDRAERSQRGLEDELGRERADALGRAGRRLEDALGAYRDAIAHAEGALAADDAEPYLDAIADRVYALLVQRESNGLMLDNLGHLRRAYDLPDAAIRRIGRIRGPQRARR